MRRTYSRPSSKAG
ncbi:hypothetical protein LINGRAHAP2_LOCUS4571 [Linum grandiflorum]